MARTLIQYQRMNPSGLRAPLRPFWPLCERSAIRSCRFWRPSSQVQAGALRSYYDFGVQVYCSGELSPRSSPNTLIETYISSPRTSFDGGMDRQDSSASAGKAWSTAYEEVFHGFRLACPAAVAAVASVAPSPGPSACWQRTTSVCVFSRPAVSVFAC